MSGTISGPILTFGAVQATLKRDSNGGISAEATVNDAKLRAQIGDGFDGLEQPYLLLSGANGSRKENFAYQGTVNGTDRYALDLSGADPKTLEWSGAGFGLRTNVGDSVSSPFPRSRDVLFLAPATPDKPVGPAIKTGVGNELKVLSASGAQVEPGDGTYYRPRRLTVSYDDKTGYFGGAPTVLAFARLSGYTAHHGSTSTELKRPDQPNVVLTRGADGKYTGILMDREGGGIGDSQEHLTRLELAFHNGSRWDSNSGNNYAIAL